MSPEHVCPVCGHRMVVRQAPPGHDLVCEVCAISPNHPPTQKTDTPISSKRERASHGPTRPPAVVKIIVILDLLGAVLFFFGAALAIAFVGDESVFLLVVAVTLFLLAGLQIAAGIGLWRLRPIGRRIQILLSSVGLIFLPFGTLISIFVLYYLFLPGVRLLFSKRLPDDITPQEWETVEQLPGVGTAAIAGAVVAAAAFFLCGSISPTMIPELLDEINRDRQFQTVLEMGTIGVAVEAYREENGHYPCGLRSAYELEKVLTPTYIDAIPKKDRWQTDLLVWSSESGTAYSIVSFGRDQVEGFRRGGEMTDFDADIVLANGNFIQWPECIWIEKLQSPD